MRTPDQIERFFASVLALPAHNAHGLTLIRWSPGEVHLAFTPGEGALGPSGDVHGGVLAMLMEPAAILALISSLPEDRYAVTADCHVQFLRPAEKGVPIALHGSVLRMGKQVAFCETRAHTTEKTLALARYTKAIIAAQPSRLA